MKIPLQAVLDAIKDAARSQPEIYTTLQEMILKEKNQSLYDSVFLLSVHKELLERSMSQLRQDLFVLFELNYKRNGYFVEFGATDGKSLSNTHLLESDFGWNGILAEPAKVWHKDLERNRKVKIDKRCVWRSSGELLLFKESDRSELSTIEMLSGGDLHAEARKPGKNYFVETVSLLDLLVEYHAPCEIDYLSIDTEGSEFDILEVFDFEKYRFKVITCEHNFSPMRERLSDLLRRNGYRRKYETLSQFDDWWVSE